MSARFPSGALEPWRGYVLAIVATAATLGVRLALDAPLGGRPTLVMFTLPIMLSGNWGGLRAGLLATGLFYFAASYVLLHRARARADSATREQRRLSGQLLRLEDEERRRLARDLHDGAAQQLAALSWKLSVVNEAGGGLDTSARRALAEGLALVHECASEIRTVSYLLHPPELDELGVRSALARYVEGFVQRSGISVESEVPPDLGRLPPSVETTVFRIVQECLTNVHRHSGSRTARIRLSRDPLELVLEVRDAGTGLRANAPPGVGMASMRERLKELGGSLEISSQPGGTNVKAVIPLSRAYASPKRSIRV
jgi:signal transduction histidine kinase